MVSDFTKLLQQYKDQREHELRLLGASITESTHSQNPSLAYGRTIKNRGNVTAKQYNLMAMLTGGEPITSRDNDPEPKYNPTDPLTLTLHGASSTRYDKVED